MNKEQINPIIPQAPISIINSRGDVMPFDKDNFLPLITAPMYSVIKSEHEDNFISNKIIPCLPRGEESNNENSFVCYSLKDFNRIYIENEGVNMKVCIDTANGNMLILHEAIKKAKKKYDNIIIMSGNVSNPLTYRELAKAGCDYVRVGIGGSSACNTTSNTGVGQSSLLELIHECYKIKYINNYKTNIVADGISSYIKYCNEKMYEKKFESNGYAAINSLLYYGADYVMVGSLFGKAEDSASEKTEIDGRMYAEYYGMSTAKAQKMYGNANIKPSEGNTHYKEVEYTLSEWINGKEEDDFYIGYINSLRSAMQYTNSRNIKDFKYQLDF